MDEVKVLSHLQGLARQFNAYAAPLADIIRYLSFSLGDDAPPTDRLDNFLRRKSTQDLLLLKYETGLWLATDKRYRLVCMAVPADPTIAIKRLAFKPVDCNMCRWCMLQERFIDLELKPDLDVYRNPISGSYLHPSCQRSWNRLKALAERAGNQKESLL